MDKNTPNKASEIKHVWQNCLNDAQITLNRFMSDPENIDKCSRFSQLLIDTVRSGGNVFSCGNGGSHCDAMHFAEELSGRYRGDRRSLAAIAISDVSHISCVSNDYGFDYIFSRFIEGLGSKGDVLLGISTSGNSANVINAVEAAKAKGMKVVILTGKDGGKLAGQGDVVITVPHFGFADRIQEVHIKVIHILILLIEKMVV